MSDEPARTARHGEGERVRFCLACGAVLPFDAQTCSACGHVDAAQPGSPGEAIVACRACLEFLSATLLFCPACGVEVAAVGPRAGTESAAIVEESAGSVPALSATLALLAPLLALLALGELVLDWLPRFRPT